MIFAGIGSRETPNNVLEDFKKIGAWLAKKGFVLRSGGAPGADSAFEEGYKLVPEHSKEIYIPWKGFNGNKSTLYGVTAEAMVIASKYHPAWARLTPPVKNLMARNVYQVLGYGLNRPADFIVCWTREAKGGGGTGQALRIAKDYSVKIYDFGSEDQKNEFREYCKSLNKHTK